MKSLAVDCRMAWMSGVGVYIRQTLPLLMERLAGVRFYLLGYDRSFDLPPRLPWEAVPLAAPIYSVSEQFRLPTVVRGCDALWMPHYAVPVFCGISQVVTIHDVAHLALRNVFTPVRRAYAWCILQAVRHKAAAIITPSAFTRDEFLRLIGRPHCGITVVPNGLDASWTDGPIPPTPVMPRTILVVGNIKPHKNIPLICRAFARVGAELDLHLVLVGKKEGFRVGETDIETLEALCPGRIHFIGPLTQDELLERVRGALALAFASRYEGFGLPPLEALGAGIPVIASDIPPVREVCGDHALYFPPECEEGLAARLREIAAMPDQEREQRTRAGREHAASFSWEKTAIATVQVLKDALRITANASRRRRSL